MVELQKQLLSKGWSYKLSTYNELFDKCEILCEIEKVLLSVIVVAWKYSEDVEKNLRLLYNQKTPQTEIIFVNNGGQELEFESVKKYIHKYVVLSTNSGACVGRNTGSIFADGQLLLFVDDDGVPDAQFIKGHLITHEVYDVVAVRGACLPKSMSNPLNDGIAHYYLKDEVCTSFLQLEGNMSIKSDLFFKVGGWDDNLFYGHEGIDLSIRILSIEPNIKKQIYSPLPLLYHDYAVSNEALNVKKEKQQNSWQALERKHPSLGLIHHFWISYRNENHDIDYKPCKLEALEELKKVTEHSKSMYSKYIDLRNIDHYELSNYQNYYKLQGILNSVQNKYIYIFGAGAKGRQLYYYIKRMNIELKGFIDNNPNICGYYIESKEIVSLESISDDAFILIASTWGDEISKQLIEKGYLPNKDFIKI